jgi:hypothetical protein
MLANLALVTDNTWKSIWATKMGTGNERSFSYGGHFFLCVGTEELLWARLCCGV